MNEDAAVKAIDIVTDAVRSGPIPGAAVVVGEWDERASAEAGRVSLEPGTGQIVPGTVFDLASLTKVLCTTPLLLRLVERGRLDPFAPFAEAMPAAGDGPLGSASLVEIVTHSAGLEPHSGLRYWDLDRKAALARSLLEPTPLPRGTILYSDKGFIALGAYLEHAYGDRLDRVAERELFGPLGLELDFQPAEPARCAHTEIDPATGRSIQGTVHDENARALDGVAGHAGLFGTSAAVADLVLALIDGRVLGPETLGLMGRELAVGPGERRAFGWLRAHDGWSGGLLAPDTALGHTGFTGTSVHLDPPSGRYHVLLTNRVHPSRDIDSNVHHLRMRFNDAAWGGP